MAVERLGPTAALISALRLEVASKRERAAGSGNSASGAGGRAASRRDIAVLRRELADIAARVPPGDEQAMDAARPRLVRAILLWEFGPELREYGEWQAMIDSIVETIQRDAEQCKALSELIEELRRG